MNFSNLIKGLKLCLSIGISLTVASAHALTQEDIDTARDALKEHIDHSNVGAGYAHLLNFFVEPDISSSFFKVDDEAGTEFDVYKLPLQKTFPINDQGWKSVVRGTVSYATTRQKAEVLTDETVDAKWKAYSGIIGSGLIIPIYGTLSFNGAADIGLARLDSDAKYDGAVLEELAPIIDGIAYNWDTNAWIGSLVLGLDYRKEFEEKYALDIKGRYTYSYISSFSESEDFPSFSDSTNTLSLKADFTHPLNTSVFNYPLYGVANLGNTTFVGDNREILGFDSFFEFGYSIKIDLSHMESSFDSLSFGYQWNKGENVEGHTFLIGWELAVF